MKKNLLAILGVALLSALTAGCCGPRRSAVATEQKALHSGSPSGQAVPSSTGVPVIKQVPTSRETMGDIHEREAVKPTPPRGDVAIPFHRIPRETVPHPSSRVTNDNAGIVPADNTAAGTPTAR